MQIYYKILDLQMRHAWSIASRQGDTGTGLSVTQTVLLKLIDSDGRVGIGEASPAPYYGESPKTTIQWLHNIDTACLDFADPLKGEDYFEYLGPRERAARCAIATALWDGAARFSGVSLGKLLRLPDTPFQAESSFTIGLANPEVIQKKTQDAGNCSIFKLKVGLDSDLENLAALRSVAPNTRLRVDANEAWSSRETALAHIEELAQDPFIECIEQPMPRSRPLADWIWLRERSPLPLMADESYITATNIDVAADGFDWVNVKLVKAGGPYLAKIALETARKRGLKTMIGCMIESSWLISAAAHLMSLADTLDLDGAALCSNDPFTGARFAKGWIDRSELAQKSGVGAQPLDLEFLKSGWHPCS